MKPIHMYHLFMLTLFIQVNSQYLSLLRELEMKNPVIVGNISVLKTRNMFDMMKYIMTQNQSIRLSTNIKNESLQQSSGIIIDQNVSKILLLMNEHLRKMDSTRKQTNRIEFSSIHIIHLVILVPFFFVFMSINAAIYQEIHSRYKIKTS